MVDGDAFSQLGRNKDFVKSLGLSAVPWDLGHHTKKTSSSLGDAFPWLGHNKDRVKSLGLSAAPWDLGH